ncbi:hypothetical protein [Bacillus sp. SG-1]|uniref:hypothetical protein n=1 Tax=Bacillus sp. SG-1 TaxID=161544 RepID=UPI0005C52DD0|nr:hypothetical protein [Bacillus sp. SG-1]
MLVHILKVVLSVLSGYLFIKWFPVNELVSVSDLIVELVLSPVMFFASSIAFMAGFLISADLIKKETTMILELFHGGYSAEILFIPVHIVGFYVLSTISLWQTLLLLSLALVYGMISVDFSGISRRA